MSSLCALCRHAGEGRNFPWKSDNAFVKVSSVESNGAFTLIEDNITSEFHLPRHCHNIHTETFYVIDGRVEFILDDRTEILTAGDTLHVQRGVAHEVRGLDPTTKMLTFYEPGGLEGLFEAYEQMDPADFADSEKMKAIEAKFDSITLGPKEV